MSYRTLCWAALVIFHLAPLGYAAEIRKLDIPPQPLSSALRDFVQQTGLQLAVESALTAGKRSPGVKGEIPAGEALDRLLVGSGLVYEFIDSKTIAVSKAGQTTALANTRVTDLAMAMTRIDAVTGDEAAANAEDRRGSDAGVDTNNENAITEIVVSAQKRLERLHDVPVPVTAISGEALLNRNQLRLQDFYANVPGLNLVSSSKGDAFISIRGVTTGATSGNPTVGITIDDIQYGPSSTYGAGGLGVPAPDIDPSDLAQIEVLRGPQGTLYGASSIGGLLKYVTADPSTTQLNGRVHMGVSTVENGSQMGHTIRGNANIPLADAFAVRVSGFERRDPGYIDDPARGADGVNRVDVHGGRVASLWRPSDAFSLKASALIQSIEGYGSPDVDVTPGLGDLQQNKLRRTGGYDKSVQLFNAIATLRFGSAELTALSSYGVNTDESTIDFTPSFGDFALNGVDGSGFDGFGVAGASLVNDFKTRKVSQELRLSTASGERAQWLFGLLYTRERSRVAQQILGVDEASGLPAGEFLDARWPTTYTEYAAFANLTLALTERFDIQFGGRQSQNRQTYSEVDAGIYGPVFFGLPDPIINPQVRTKDNSFTYLITPRFRVTPDFMAYARLASGYRAGGPNPTSTVFGLPPHFEPDTTRNYEVGAKVDFPGRRLSIDTSVYYIDWTDIQLNVFDPVSFATYFVNGSRAKSQGLEFAVESSPVPGLKITTWAAYNDAQLTESFPDLATLFGAAGDRLPNSSKISGHISIDHQLSLSNDFSVEYGASLDYVGDRKGAFVSVAGAPDRQEFPAYSQVNLRGGISRDAWTLNVFVTNLADKRGVIAGGLGTFDPIAFTYIQPRTIGMTLAWNFGRDR